jgi:signal transduction histidine kinase/CheY-like chemotaxis protein
MILNRSTRSAQACALVAVLAGSLVLVGWFADIVWLKSVVPGFIAMNPLTAICFILLGVCLYTSSSEETSRPRPAAWGAATLVAAIGGLRLAADVFHLNLPIDRYLFAETLGTNRMAPNTGLCFLLTGLALLLLDVTIRRRFWPAQALALVVTTISLISLLGYSYGAESLYHIAYIPMALHTAAVFNILSLGILAARPQRGLHAVLMHPGPGGVMMRRLLPAVVLIPCFLGWLRLVGQHLAFYDTEFGAAIMVATTIMVFSIAMFSIAAALNRADLKRCDAELAMQQLNEELEARVQSRTEELEKRDRQLHQAQKMEAIGTLAGGVSHEFNNLLQAIQGFTRYAMEGVEHGSDAHSDLLQVLEASDRAVVLTRQLLGFSRREVLQKTDIEPNTLVRSLAKMLTPLIGEHITMNLELDPQVGFVHADASHLQQLLMNLCVNARDAMPKGGQLTIRTENAVLTPAYCELHEDVEPGRYLMLAVSDTGSGIPAEIKDHIFDPFFTTKGVGKGTGLGLAMVYGMVRQHQGAIRVYSEPGAGTTFRIYLPTTDHAAPAAMAAITAPSRIVRGGTETILVAEDDPTVRQLAVRVLERAGYHAIIAVDGEDAVRLFREHASKISCALLDVVMPRLGGREAFQRIKALDPEMKAIYCSGYDPSMAQVGFVMDDDARLIQKPFVPEALLTALREILDGTPCQLTTH